jgi:hypothetical protein
MRVKASATAANAFVTAVAAESAACCASVTFAVAFNALANRPAAQTLHVFWPGTS